MLVRLIELVDEDSVALAVNIDVVCRASLERCSCVVNGMLCCLFLE